LSIKHQKPVSLGISGPGMSERQAFARIRPVSERVVEAVFNTAKELKRIK
ncbi:MAG: 6,7-dimethyl-8-ribityllumazine synthase, partial [Thaumarchaeota archaeon]